MRCGADEPITSSEFDEFWSAYPRRVAKKAARIAYMKARHVANHATILAGARQYAEECRHREPEKICHAATWLNGERWEDEPESGYRRPSNGESLIEGFARAAGVPMERRH